MTLLEDFLANINYPPAILLKQYLEDGIPEHLQPLMQCVPTDWCRKSSSKSSELRDLGNAACRSQNYEEALMYYSRSIAAAPTDSEALALAYGNRSAILQVQREYELCLLDTNRALDGSLPQSSRMKLLQRKARSWDKLQEEEAMRAKLRAGLSTIKRSSQDRANLLTHERKLCYISEMDIDDTHLVIDHSLIDDPMFETKFENKICKNLSPKVQRRVDEEWGQVFIATDDIEPGEILSNDVSHCLIVYEDKQHKYCSYCNVWCKALIPCVSCSLDMYCCYGCREKAYDIYHRTECKMLALWGRLSERGRMFRRLFLRIFLTGTKQGSDLTALLNDPRVYAALNGNFDHTEARYPSENYLPILNSVWKIEGDIYDRFEEAFVSEALEIFVGMRYVRFFGTGEKKTQCSGNTLTDEEQLTTLLLVQNLSLGYSQTFPTFANYWETEGPAIVREDEIGGALGPWHTFMNPSCYPNAARVMGGQRILCHSVRPIKAGEQIFLSETIVYLKDTREDRQIKFKEKTGRECSCIACVENWPPSLELETTRTKYLTSNRVLIKKIVKMHNWLSNKIDCSIAEEDLKKVIEFSSTICEYIKEPSYTMILCEFFLCRAMKSKTNLYFSQQFIASLYRDL